MPVSIRAIIVGIQDAKNERNSGIPKHPLNPMVFVSFAHLIIVKYLLAPIYLLYKLWIGFVFWTSLLLLYPIFWILLSRKEWFPQAFAMKRFWSWMLRTLMFCPVSKSLKASLPPAPYIIASNHSSYLDTVFMYAIFDDYFLFIGKGELLKWPLFRRFFQTMDIPVKRENNKQAWQSLQKAYEAIDRGDCIAIYPEGTIPRSTPKMKAFKNGAFRMAIDKQVPIVPVTWVQNYKIMNDPGKLFSPSLPHVVRVVIHEPITPPLKFNEEDMVNLRSIVFEKIQSALPSEFHRSFEELPEKA
jgi:1-acyl-sn-glycerol-3-phosphate acyltransferase